MSADPHDTGLAEVAAAMDRLLARVDEMHAAQRAEYDVLRRYILGALGKTRSDIMGKVAELQGEVAVIRDDTPSRWARPRRRRGQ